MLEANGLRFRALVEGPSDGDMVLMLHGFPEGSESWVRQMHVLAHAGFLAVAPDLRGYGMTDAPENVDDYTLDRLVADTKGLIEGFGRKSAHVAGHDWGAVVAWYFAGAHPEMTTTLTVLSVGHPTALGGARRVDADQQERSRYLGLFVQPGKAEAVLEADDYQRLRAMYRLGPNPDAIPERVIDGYVRSMSRPGRLTAGLNYYRANLKQGGWEMGPIGDITSPTQLIWGDQDPALGRLQAESTADHVMGRFHLQVLEKAGHWLQFERPDEVGLALSQVTAI